MKRKLLLFFAMLCVSLGTWATITTSSTTWCQWNSYADQENVLTIYVDDPGELATAIAGLDFTDVKILHISARNREASLLELSSEDIAALSSVNVETIEMMRAYVSPFTFTNSNLKRVILPYNWTRDEVKAFGEANSTSANFEACISMNDQDAYESRTDDAALIAYLNKPNTLKDAIMRTWNDTHGYAPLGNTIHQGGGDCSRLKYLTVMGSISARDISSKGTYDENGHYVTNGVPDENSDTYNKNTDGGDYYVAGETPGALTAYTNDLYVLDLKDAYVPNEYAADIVFPYSQMGGSNLREIWMPEDSRFNTVPADYLNISCNVRQICIPGNIKYIKTRSFAGTSGTGRMCYIWTTGPDPLVKYDNGAAFVNGDETTWKYMNNAGEGNVAMTASDYNQFQYGTFTLPAGLELIERFAFSQSTSVSDVYVLNKVAPECHVDAFNCTMYLANNTLQTQYIKDGIVTREAYRNDGSGKEYKFVTILHYPRETTDPNIQRYTDPTREYSIATGERDGNGSTIYYPNHSEMTYAYFQGSFGYLWKGWDDSRNWYDQSLKAGYGEGLPATESSHHPDRAGAQATANQRWIDNEYNADQKADRSFYDVTTGGNNQPGETAAPSGLTPYYENRYSGYDGVLYPQMETTETTEVIGERQSVDSNGDPIFDPCSNGNYVKDFIYVPAENGEYVQVATVNGYQGTQTPVEGVSTYYSDNQGSNAVTPKVQNGYFFEDGVKNVYTQVDKNSDAVGAKSQYYTKNGDVYTPSNLMFNTNYYYYSEDGEMKGWVQEYGWANPNANHYTSQDLSGTPIKAGDEGFDYQAQYWVYYTDVVHYIASDHFISGKTWYSYDQNSQTYNTITLNWYNHFTNETYYYVSGTEANYSSADGQDYNASTTYYTSNTGETEVNPVNFNTTYYYPTYDYSYVDYTGQEGDRYTKKDSYREWTSTDGEAQRYCPRMEDVYATIKGTQYDYRGWHQFILTGRSYDYIVPMEPLRSFITDNDWWTICEPYDLRYSDLIKFFGYDRAGFDKKIPYLSKLMYVVRDVENQQITLMFSKNLMEYKEQFVEADGTLTGKEQFVETNGKSSGRVHGFVDDETKWTADELAQDPVILHAGVPYLIRPNLVFEDGKAQRQFDIFKSSNEDLYNRLKDSEDLPGDTQMDFVHNGIYTVPAFVVGYNSADAVSESTIASGVKEIEMKDGTKFTYKDSEHGGKKLKYKGKDVDYKISSDYTYSFVGTFYKSVIPQYSYFLGWDSNANRATFWYSAQQDKTGWNWNNETGIICPNFVNLTAEQQKIHKATAVADPARWTLVTQAGASLLGSDDFRTASGAKSYDMESDGISMVGDSEVTGIEEIVPATTESETVSVYNVNGVFMGNSVEGLAKGIYIVNGKKYVVK